MRLEIGDIVDNRYRLVSVIGSGGMGVVFEALNIDIGLRVALKTLRYEFVDVPEANIRFRQEAKFSACIEHENICQVIDAGNHLGKLPYLVMPLLNGKTLSRLIEKGTLSFERIAGIMIQVLSGLHEAHRQNIVHRDLKASNIFITQLGGRADYVKILDFGVSKRISCNTHETFQTATGNIPGTSHYLAPEQAMGEKVIDYTVDIYASGVIMYKAMTGRYPFEGDNPNEILYKIATAPFLPARKLNSAIPESVERIVLKAMSRDPMKRYRNAVEMRADLEYELSVKSVDSETPTDESITVLPEKNVHTLGEKKAGKNKSAHTAWHSISIRLAVVTVLILLVVLGLNVFSISMKLSRGESNRNAIETRRPSTLISETTDDSQPTKMQNSVELTRIDANAATEKISSQSELTKYKMTKGGREAPQVKTRNPKPAEHTDSSEKKETMKHDRRKNVTREKKSLDSSNNIKKKASKKDVLKKVSGPLGTEIVLEYEL